MKRLTVLFMLFALSLPVAQVLAVADVDIEAITIRGNSANYGMSIDFIKEYDYGFKAITAGAEFVFEKSKSTMKMYQRIGVQRFVGQVTFGSSPQELKMRVNTPDHVLFEATDFFMGIYGDSACIVAAKTENLRIDCEGSFLVEEAPCYEGEVVLIGDYGGVSLLPQRHEAGYKTLKKLIGRTNWQICYEFKKSQRIMISVFPPREFNEEQSYTDRVVVTAGYVGDDVLPAWRKYTNILVLDYGGLYAGRSDWKGYIYPSKPYAYAWSGPYKPTQPEELKRVVKTAHRLGFKVCVYVSPFYHFAVPEEDIFFADAADIFTTYNLDGFFIDGLYRDCSGEELRGNRTCPDDKIKNYELMRRLRQLVGVNGILFLHGTGDRTALMAIPNIDALADFTLYAEYFKFTDFNDPYIKSQVRKYGISNTIGMIKPDRRPDISQSEIADRMLKMHNRERWRAHLYQNAEGQVVWPLTPPPYMLRYYRQLNALKAGVPLETVLKMPPE